MTLGHMTVVILATMMTAEVAAAADVTTTIVVADETMIAPEIMSEETVSVSAVVMVEIGMMTGGIRWSAPATAK
jgi:hypothetical protein